MHLLFLPASVLPGMQPQTACGVGDTAVSAGAHFFALSFHLRVPSPLHHFQLLQEGLALCETGLRGRQSATSLFVLNANVGHCSVFRGSLFFKPH